MAVAEEAEVPNAVKAVRQHVNRKRSSETLLQ
jgi:hypothetical protein